MVFIDDASVIQSWQNLNNKTYNRFWGFLGVLRQIHEQGVNNISPVETYQVSGSNISTYLQDIFHFGNDIRAFGASSYYVTFSQHWKRSIASIFLKERPNIYDVAIVATYPFALEREFTHQELLEHFFINFNLTREHFGDSVVYDTSTINLGYTAAIPANTTARNTRNTKQTIHRGICGAFSVPESQFNLTIESAPHYVAAHPGELTRAPFFQTLYQNPSVQECVLITKFDFSDYYPINTEPPLTAVPVVRGNGLPRNKIIYGAPGTGKSYELNRQASSAGFLSSNTIRLTFHPNYSYQQFVGTYKPTPLYKTTGEPNVSYYGNDRITVLNSPLNKEPIIDYSFVGGPFLKLLIEAIQHPEQDYLLIIEEINRAPVSAVFGDVFQLLDRKEDGSSQYEVEFNTDIMAYIRSKGIEFDKIGLPSNLYLWATMNSADQGVMPLDAAFKRRWAFEYLPLNSKQDVVAVRTISFQGTRINWNHFREKVNNRLKELGVAEDKLIGPFFLGVSELESQNTIKNKLLLYLRDDVVRHSADNLFVHGTFSDIIEAYDRGSIIFNNITFEEGTNGEDE